MINFDDISKGIDLTNLDQFNASVICTHSLMTGREFPFESMKILSDNHETGCHCTVCDFVQDAEHEQSILHPVSEPVYVY
jgi:hypothetical protein